MDTATHPGSLPDAATIAGAPFPDPRYRDTVLAPLFHGVASHHAGHMSAIDRAHLVMLEATGILEREAAATLANGLAAIERELDPASLDYTGEHEDWFFQVEAELERRVGADLGGRLHTARSRNDIDHTVFRLALGERLDDVLSLSLQLAGTLLAKARLERDTPIVAYTHGQPAQPTTFAHYLHAVLETLLGDIERLLCARDTVDACPMGAAAITTTGFAIDRHLTASLLGFSRPKRNSYNCIASIDYITASYSALKLPLLHLGRVTQDLAFWSAFEVGQLRVPDSLVQISSIMPQKRNPVPIEHMRHLASMTVGRCDAITATLHNTPFTDMNDSEGEVQVAGYAAFDSAGRVLRLFDALIARVGIDAERVARNADAACVTITELADTLVRDEQLSFRQAHHIAAATARAVIADGRTLAQGHAAFANAFAEECGHASQLDQERYAEAVSLQAFIARRDRFGGPAPAAMDDALDAAAELHARLADRAALHTERRRAAHATLAERFATLVDGH